MMSTSSSFFRRVGWGPSLLLAAALGTACGDDSLSQFQPRIEVEPESLDFGEGIVARDNLLDLLVQNRGTGRLVIERIDFEPDDGIFKVATPLEGVAAAGEETLGLSFVPAAPKVSYSATMFIVSNDPERPRLAVPLQGVGGIREIEVFPAAVDFGVVDEGTREVRTVEIRNTGGDPLLISSLVFTSTSVDLRLLAGGFSGGALEPKTSTTVTFEYAPMDLGADEGLLIIESNDADEPRVEVPVTGRANLAPVAIAWGCTTEAGQIGCDGAEQVRRISLRLQDRLGLEGRDSFDPEGEPIESFRWQVVDKPSGSNAIVFHSTEDRTLRRSATGDVQIDRIGKYDLRLIVRDERGLESFDLPESHVVVAPKDIEVLLRWDIVTDMDLHFVRPGGAAGDYGSGRVGTSTGSDCTWLNPAPNWNDPGTNLDDPRYELDVVNTREPEVVGINSPEIGDVYRVFAHYCDGQNVGAATNVTVEIYLRGELIQTIPSDGQGYRLSPGELWEGAQVEWVPGPNPSLSITDLSASSPVLRPSLCRR